MRCPRGCVAGAAISLLLVFRTNACYARFVEGRMLWGSVVKLCRDWVRPIPYTPHPKSSRDSPTSYPTLA